jgi:hypothetical protein
VRKALGSGDVARARQVASEISNPELRRSILAQIDHEQLWSPTNPEKTALIQQELNRLPGDEQRVEFLLTIASQGGIDRKSTLALLNQAGEIIDSLKPGKTKLEGQLSLAIAYCSINSDRGFAIMESLVPRLNELVAAAATLDGLENNYLREGEWNMSSEGFVGRLLAKLSQNAGCFARMDFDRSVTLANQFERNEIRVMAQTRIAQAILADQIYRALIVRPQTVKSGSN